MWADKNVGLYLESLCSGSLADPVWDVCSLFDVLHLKKAQSWVTICFLSKGRESSQFRFSEEDLSCWTDSSGISYLGLQPFGAFRIKISTLN